MSSPLVALQRDSVSHCMDSLGLGDETSKAKDRCPILAPVLGFMAHHLGDQVTLQAVCNAERRVRPHIHTTPVLKCSFVDKATGRDVHFKCESFQRTGSFKLRGALNAMLRVTELRRGCDDGTFTAVAYSSGNHGQAVAHAASILGMTSKIVVPTTTPNVKKESIRGYGGDVLECSPSLQARAQMTEDAAAALGRHGEIIPPSDHPFIIAGQGTVAMEILKQVSDLDAIIAPAGGGGLVAATCLVAKAMKPGLKVYAAEPVTANDLQLSFDAKRRITNEDFSDTIAEGLRSNISLRCWPLILDGLHDVITVTDQEIVDAMKIAWQRMKIAVEPSGAVAMAAVMSDNFRAAAGDVRRVAVVISGGNVDLATFTQLMTDRPDS